MQLGGGHINIDGVLLAFLHERAWREALRSFADVEHLINELCQPDIAGKPRLSGAIAALESLE